jgi:hypothetical protein
MRIYIASSWKNQHAVEMLTALLREASHQVFSFVENPFGEHLDMTPAGFGKWILSKGGAKAFKYDTDGATKCDLVIYISPSGTDAWAEVGAAWASGVTVLGLYAKGEQSGLMRLMVKWFDHVFELLAVLDDYAPKGGNE